MFRFIHTADLHLDSPLKALSRRNADLAEAIGVATRAAFERIVDKAIEERVAALLISGDLYDGSTKDMRTGLYLAECLRRLGKAGVHTFIILGNHDAETVAKPPFPDVETLTVFKPKASTHRFEEHEVAIHGASFRDNSVTADMTPGYPDPVQGWVNIGMLHTSLGGFSEHADYAPTSPARLGDKGYDYWALGHVHKSQVFQEGTPERPWIVYPGIPQGRDMGETGQGRAVLGTVSDGRINIEWFDTSAVVLERVPIDLSSAESFNDIQAEAGDIARTLIDASDHGRALLRPELAVPRALVPAVRRGRDDLLDLIQTNIQARTDRVAVEKIGIVASAGDNQRAEIDKGTLAHLTDMIRTGATADSDLVKELVKDFEAILAKLPPGLRAHPGHLNPLTDLDPESADHIAGWLESMAAEAVASAAAASKGDGS
ncbi:MAG: DNA repair exonuclease [Alphaproteobacteria bacterium]|nr:DNA repair exonuclease [Alphaproteobacteria bacterium]